METQTTKYEQDKLFFKNLEVGSLVKIKEDLVENEYYEAPLSWCWDNHVPCRICYDDVEFINPGTICKVTNVDGDGTCWLEPLLEEEYEDVWDECLWYSFAMLEMVGTDTVCEDSDWESQEPEEYDLKEDNPYTNPENDTVSNDEENCDTKGKFLTSFSEAVKILAEGYERGAKLEMYCSKTEQTLTMDVTGFLCVIDEDGIEGTYFTPNAVDILELWEIKDHTNCKKYREALNILKTTLGNNQTVEEKALIDMAIRALTAALN